MLKWFMKFFKNFISSTDIFLFEKRKNVDINTCLSLNQILRKEH